jgi:hypothetical protein
MERRWTERILPKMRFCWKVFAAAALLWTPVTSLAATCTSQAELAPQDRLVLAATGQRLLEAAMGQDLVDLKTDLLPAEAPAWDAISATVEQAQPLLKGGKIQLRDVYLLDTGNQSAPADTEFFCSNASGSLTVTIFMRALPPGRYAMVLAEAAGAPMGGQLGLILAWDGPAAGWKLAGLTVHQGIFDGHDGVWYWERARSLAKEDPWSAWYCYDLARSMLLPVDFLSSPNLDKLNQEQLQIESSPQKAFPLSVPGGERTWKIDAVGIDVSLHEPDLAVVYESTGVTDPAAQRTEAIAVLSAFLKAQPGLRENFHGLWAIASKDGKQTAIIELPMAQIP